MLAEKNAWARSMIASFTPEFVIRAKSFRVRMARSKDPKKDEENSQVEKEGEPSHC